MPRIWDKLPLMQFHLRRPCPHCPFRSDGHPYLVGARAQELADALKFGNWFGCHETTESDEESGESMCTDDTEHCAGAMILLEKIGWPSQAMQLSERLQYPRNAFYDPNRLDMEAPVFNTLEEFVSFHSRSSR